MYTCYFSALFLIHRSDRLNVVRNYQAPADSLSTGGEQARPPFVVEFEYLGGGNSGNGIVLFLMHSILVNEYLVEQCLM